jgi:uncharacterized protein (DUF2249 family)
MTTAQTVPVGGVLKLVTPFQPVPLYTVLGGIGFRHASACVGPAHWETLFTREAAGAAEGAAPPACGCSDGRSVVEVDVRGLEPPQPMVRILEALDAAGSGVELRARTDRRPLHLLDLLQARALTAESSENDDGSWTTAIWPA